jgi:hypothetical protein
MGRHVCTGYRRAWRDTGIVAFRDGLLYYLWRGSLVRHISTSDEFTSFQISSVYCDYANDDVMYVMVWSDMLSEKYRDRLFYVCSAATVIPGNYLPCIAIHSEELT